MTLYYGNGDCELDGSDITYCIIGIKYPLEIVDKSPSGYALFAKDNRITISRYKKEERSTLKELFSYVGNMQIIRAVVINTNGDKESPIIKRVMDYTELLTSTTESMTINTEDMKATSVYVYNVPKTTVYPPTVDNLHTGSGKFYLKDGSPFSGYYHIHKDGFQYMTGTTHADDSQNMYFKEEFEGIVYDKLILHNFAELKKTRAQRVSASKMRKRIRRK